MVVYIVEHINTNYTESLVGVFSTLGKAEAFIDKCSDPVNMWVSTLTVDEEELF